MVKEAVAVLLVGLAGSASAHSLLLESVPANGEVRERVERVTIRYSQELDTKRSRFRVFDAGGRQVGTRDGRVDLNDPDHASLLLTLPAPLPPGRYTVRWTAVSAEDGDVTRDELGFVVK
ncbi:MAG TPA: copper resistance protein CopC [Candidatus Binatia bacterium]|jgi:methionine-rich copper-binding protein CopC|nr:copper resistance protein CopC [Candidatus Binatia bacterium]